MKWILAGLATLSVAALVVIVLIRSSETESRPQPEAAPLSSLSPTARREPAKPIVPVPEEEDDPNRPLKDPEPLPEPPKLDAKNEHKALLPDKSLLLETTTAADGKPKPVRLLFAAEVCLRRGPLEVLLCRKNTKEHEAVLRTSVDAKLIHAALIALGAKPGAPAQFFDPKTEKEDYKPASGETIEVSVHYKQRGKPITQPAQDWIRDSKTKKPMEHRWVFAGSRFLKDPEQPDKPAYYAANNGEIIGISNFVDSMLDIPVNVSRDDDSLAFVARTEAIPPVFTKVWLILTVGK